MTNDTAIPIDVPHYTGSLDASIPGENIVSVQFDESSDKWIAIHRDKRGRLFVGVGNTEPLARRIAALTSLSAATPNIASHTEADVRKRRNNLITSLERLSEAIEKNNEYRIADPQDQKRRTAEVKSLLLILKSPAAIGAAVAGFMLSTLTYLSVKFADGVIGKLASSAVALVEKMIGN